MLEIDGDYRTEDLVLATLLVSQGFACSMVRLNSRKVAWVFPTPEENAREEEMDELLFAYEERRCKVEPLSFQQELARVRDDMHTFLGVVPHRRRSGSPSIHTQTA